jgi:hypothetical protein
MAAYRLAAPQTSSGYIWAVWVVFASIYHNFRGTLNLPLVVAIAARCTFSLTIRGVDN